MKALVWYIDRIFEATCANREQRPDGDVLDGIAASPGRYTGPVRVITDESRFDRLRSGDVIVCPITSPVCSVLFPSVEALVTDTVGVLSHPAIIAREYRCLRWLQQAMPLVCCTTIRLSALTVRPDGSRSGDNPGRFPVVHSSASTRILLI
jgi:hypothetical protein